MGQMTIRHRGDTASADDLPFISGCLGTATGQDGGDTSVSRLSSSNDTMSFTLRATYKDTTRNLLVPVVPGSFPQYDQVITKIRKSFDLPDGTQIAFWHVYFSKNDGIEECRFRRHVCNVEE